MLAEEVARTQRGGVFVGSTASSGHTDYFRRRRSMDSPEDFCRSMRLGAVDPPFVSATAGVGGGAAQVITLWRRRHSSRRRTILVVVRSCCSVRIVDTGRMSPPGSAADEADSICGAAAPPLISSSSSASAARFELDDAAGEARGPPEEDGRPLIRMGRESAPRRRVRPFERKIRTARRRRTMK